MKDPSKRRIAGAVFLSWLAVLGLDFLLHAGILARLYQEPSPFLLSPEQAFKLIPLGYLSFLLVSVLIVWLLLRIKIQGRRAGLIFGLKLGALLGGASILGLLSISTASVTLMLGWSLGQLVEIGFASFVAVEFLETERPGRLLVYVLVLVLIAFIFTIVMQNTGLAPAARIIGQ
jgi:hypothetical protein